jgi:hypothetical protein
MTRFRNSHVVLTVKRQEISFDVMYDPPATPTSCEPTSCRNHEEMSYLDHFTTALVTELVFGTNPCRVRPTSGDLKDGEMLKSIMNHLRIGDQVTSMAIGVVGIVGCSAQ